MLFLFQHCLAMMNEYFFLLCLAMDFQVCIGCVISSIMFSIQLILLSTVTENGKLKEGSKEKNINVSNCS